MIDRYFRTRGAPLALLALCLVSFGLLAPWLGFYWDDWPTIWYLHILGPAGFKDVFSVDRPLLGWLFILTTSVLGESALGWQLFGVLMRWLSALSFWSALRLVWPARLREATWIAFLFVVYPGFMQQPISVTYSHVWLLMAVFFLSISTMIGAFRKSAWFWPLTLASWLLAAYTLFSVEYFFGLELLRPVLLWLVLSESIQDRIRRLARTILLWLPYAAISAGFLIWRLFLTDTPRGSVQALDLPELARKLVVDSFQAGILAWAQPFNFPRLLGFGSGPTALYLVVVALAFPLVWFFLFRFKPEAVGKNERLKPSLHNPAGSAGSSPFVDRPKLSQQSPSASVVTTSVVSSWPVQAILIGLFSLALGGIPFWLTGLPIELRFPWDRFTLAMMPGASLLLAGALELLVRPLAARRIAAALVIALGIGLHVQQANLFRREWNAQKMFFWQLTWRAPALEQGTTLLTSELPFTFFSDNSLTAPLNWTYASQGDSLEMAYIFYAVESRLRVRLTDLEKGLPIYQPYRATSFTGSTSQTVALFSKPPGCVKVIDPAVDKALPQKPNYYQDLLELSDPRLILETAEQPAQPPVEIFGPEPEHGWCYYYEKADLARQYQDWVELVALGEQAFRLNQRLYEVNAPELVPYIEGYAHLEKWERAEELTLQAHDLTFRMQRMLCSAWERIEAGTPASQEQQAAVASMNAHLKCAR